MKVSIIYFKIEQKIRHEYVVLEGLLKLIFTDHDDINMKRNPSNLCPLSNACSVLH